MFPGKDMQGRLRGARVALFSLVLLLSSQVCHAQSGDPVVFPGKGVGNFWLGMSKETVRKIAPKPQEVSANRLGYISAKTGNALVLHFQNNHLVQIDFTSKEFYTAEGIHPGNFRDARYGGLFDVNRLSGTAFRRKLTLKTGGLTFYDPHGGVAALATLSPAVGVVHPGGAPLYDLSPHASALTAGEGGRAEHIPLLKQGGIYHVPIEINGVLTLHFILDSGASDVAIPAEVALTLYRAGTIRPDDFLPGKTYVLADGSTVASERFLLRSLKIGNREVGNVPASIGPVFSPLLLGQSFLERLGTWGIDSQRAVLFLSARPLTIHGQ